MNAANIFDMPEDCNRILFDPEMKVIVKDSNILKYRLDNTTNIDCYTQSRLEMSCESLLEPIIDFENDFNVSQKARSEEIKFSTNSPILPFVSPLIEVNSECRFESFDELCYPFISLDNEL